MKPEGQEPLFKPEATSSTPPSFSVYIAVPSGSEFLSELAAIQRACQQAAIRGVGQVRAITGADAHDLKDQDLRKWIYQQFTGTVDGVILISGKSWGCGYIDALARNLSVPRLIVYPTGEMPSQLAGADGTTASLSVGHFADTSELEALTVGWLESLAEIVPTNQERARQERVRVEPLRQALLRQWKTFDPIEKGRLAHDLSLTTSQLDDMLMDDGEVAELRVGHFLTLTDRLGTETIGRPSQLTHEHDLSHDELQAFDTARRTYKWTKAEAEAVLQLGRERAISNRELVSTGVELRYSLKGRFAWYRLYQELFE